MAHRLRLPAVALAAAILAAPHGAAGQSCATRSADAKEYTIGDILVSLENGARQANLATLDKVANDSLTAIAARLRSAGTERVTIGQLAALIVDDRVGFLDVLRDDQREVSLLTRKQFHDAVLALPRIGISSILPILTDSGVRLEDMQESLAPVLALGSRVRACASANSAEKLRHIEVKYGEGSPALNLPEALVNHALQWFPVFGPSKNGWPSRYEFIAAFRPMELASTGGSNATLVSAGQLGVRWYHWDPAWGTGSVIDQLKRPRHASIGGYVVGPEDKAFRSPVAKGRRFGAFFGWGDVHAAYVFESPRRVLIGHGKQIVPYAF